MATYHFSVKFGSKGKALGHANYISREAEYQHRGGLEHIEHGNMPTWAQENPAHFWQAADTFERANGSGYREFEIALPRELTSAQRIELVRDFIREELGDKHAYSVALHNAAGSIDDGEQPHAHIMMSQRVNDGIERSPEQYFKRYNAKFPERGGARKDSGHHLTPTEQREELKGLRERWEKKHNEHMQRHGQQHHLIDSRSHKTRGINRTPEHHFGFKAAGRMTAEQKLAIRDLRALSNSDIRYCELKKSDFSQALAKDYYQSASQSFKAEYGQGAEMLKTFKLDLTKNFQQEHNKKLQFNYQSGKAEVKPLRPERGLSRGWSM
ncbi:MobA/MobL family protein [Arsenophonus nasoniae]|uniref:MobA/MobL family protein n=1 Tax=Arsenophonus nasoniae TaxID=638 RepID=A0AA95GDD1_9GAMM|nr:MobA/MobL family protein [Arsenophonus nasoniae]WGL94105.1 MobA/MobL family protein [Arsenophonus nasoniae]